MKVFAVWITYVWKNAYYRDIIQFSVRMELNGIVW